MSSDTRVPEQLEKRRSLGRERLRATGISLVVVLHAWGLMALLDVELRSPAFGDQPTHVIGLTQVLPAALIAMLAGWGLLALLERRSGRSGRVWVIAAVAGLVLSLGGPFSGTGIEASTRLALASLHVVTGLVFIPLMLRTVMSPEDRA